MTLKKYREKRDFSKTPEPKGKKSHQHEHLFIIQKHAASHLHYDFRLELNGVLLSWAVPKGPSFDSTVKRLAMHVEDHPVEYGFFEGIIPKGEYGGGTVMLWDKGIWQPLDEEPAAAYQKGHLRFNLIAEKLKGRWDLFRFKDDKHWFLVKHKDEFAQSASQYDVTIALPDSILSQQTLQEIAENQPQIWTKHGLEQSSTVKKKLLAQLVADYQLKQTPLLDNITPQLATLVAKAPADEQWLHEVKFDGYRIIAFLHTNKVVLKSRTKNDWTDELRAISNRLQQLKLANVVFDGEVVMLDKQGKSDFQLLQNTIKLDPHADYVYYIFDLLYYDGFDLRTIPLLKRKELLKSLLQQQEGMLRYSDHILGNGAAVFSQSCELTLEGIICKQIDSFYTSGRSTSWAKVKCIKRQEFVIGGYSPPKGERDYFGALYLGVYNPKGELEYAGNVGTGFTAASLKELHHQLKMLVIDHSPFNKKIPASAKATWVEPVLIAEIEFTQWTQEGHLRHPSFKGLRLDKNAVDVRHEKEISVTKLTTSKAKAVKKSTFKITHPDKIIYPENGYTKQELLDYYEAVSDFILPFIKNRALSLVRCLKEYDECFFQRHYTKSTPKQLKPIAIKGKEGTEEYIYLDDKLGLLSLVQMGVLEIHPWGSLITNLERPDYLVIDLDPAPDVSWPEVVLAAQDIRQHLQQFNLRSFVKTTGGKGLHVVVPILPEYEWNEVKNFTHVFVQFLEQLKPEHYISVMNKAKRKGKIFIDYLRNQRGATAIGTYSSRARPHAPVSVPIDWDELTADKRDSEFTIKTLPKRLSALKKEPWHDFWLLKQSLRLADLIDKE